TDMYNDAEEGQAWALIADTWQWTITPTPGNANVLAAAAVKAATTKTAAPKKAATTKKPAPVKAASKKAKATKTSAPKTVKPKAGSVAAATDIADIDPTPPSVHAAVLVGVGT